VTPCFAELDFKDVQAFKSAGTASTLAPNTVERLRLIKQLPKDSVATEALKGAAVVVSGLTIGLAVATPFLSAGAG
jgi:hypothetical protein